MTPDSMPPADLVCYALRRAVGMVEPEFARQFKALRERIEQGEVYVLDAGDSQGGCHMKHDRELIKSIHSAKGGVIVRKKDGKLVKVDLDSVAVILHLDDTSFTVERTSHGVIAEMLDELADSKHADGLYLVTYAQDKTVIDGDFVMYSEAFPLRESEP